MMRKIRRCFISAIIIMVMLIGTMSVYAADKTYEVKTSGLGGGSAAASQVTPSAGWAYSSCRADSYVSSVYIYYYAVNEKTLKTTSGYQFEIKSVSGTGSSTAKQTADDGYTTWKVVASHSVIYDGTTWKASTTAYYDY